MWWLVQHLDFVAMFLTGGSTILFARRKRVAWISLGVGACVWFAIGALATFGGRPVYGQMASSAITACTCVWGWKNWRPSVVAGPPRT